MKIKNKFYPLAVSTNNKSFYLSASQIFFKSVGIWIIFFEYFKYCTWIHFKSIFFTTRVDFGVGARFEIRFRDATGAALVYAGRRRLELSARTFVWGREGGVGDYQFYLYCTTTEHHCGRCTHTRDGRYQYACLPYGRRCTRARNVLIEYSSASRSVRLTTRSVHTRSDSCAVLFRRDYVENRIYHNVHIYFAVVPALSGPGSTRRLYRVYTRRHGPDARATRTAVVPVGLGERTANSECEEKRNGKESRLAEKSFCHFALVFIPSAVRYVSCSCRVSFRFSSVSE